MILLCYDGSADAQAAVDRAGELMPAEAATVLTVWEGFTEVLARARSGLGASAIDVEDVDSVSRDAARRQAEEGVQRARTAGLAAEGIVCERGATVWKTILEAADRIDAKAIVVGSRGLSRVKSVLLGSVSGALLQHADRPVIVVPSPQVATRRATQRHSG